MAVLLTLPQLAVAQIYPDRAIKIHPPTDVLWPQHDPLFPQHWADQLEHYFIDVQLHIAIDAGHFTPLECPVWCAAIRAS